MPLLEEPRKIHRETARVRTNYPTVAIFLGIAVSLVGLGILAVPFFVPDLDVPLVVGWMGLNFFILGEILAAGAFRSRAARKKAEAWCGSDPWRYDHPWNMQGADDESGMRIGRLLFIWFVFAMFIAPFNILIAQLDEKELNWIPYFVVGLFDLVLVIMVLHLGYLVLHRLKFGKSRVRFQEFPYYHTNGTLTLGFEGSRALRNRQELEAELVCVSEFYERTASSRDTNTQLVHEALFLESRRFSTDAVGYAELKFDIPADAPGTSLLESPAIYWELVVKADVPGVDYEGFFLLPIYRRDGSSSTPPQ